MSGTDLEQYISTPAEQSRRAANAEQTGGDPLEVFARSAAYAGIQAPLTALTQVYDKVTGSSVTAATQYFDAPEPSDFFSTNWHAQQLGTVVGMVPWVVGLHKASSKAVGLQTAMIEGATAQQIMAKRMLASALTGGVYGAVLTPSQDTNNLFLSRFRDGLRTAATFTTLTGAGIGLQRLGVRNPILGGAASGLPAGLVDAGLHSGLRGELPTFDDLGKSAYTFTALGGLMGAGRYANRPSEATARINSAINTTRTTEADYFNRLIETRTAENHVGSYWDMSRRDLLRAVRTAKWEPYNPVDAQGNQLIKAPAVGFRATIAGGKVGIVPLESIPKDAIIELVDPKGVTVEGKGGWSLATRSVGEANTKQATMMLGPVEGPGGTVLPGEMVWTMHPGEPVSPSNVMTPRVESLGIKVGNLPKDGPGRRIQITHEQARQLGLDMVKIEVPE